jgi:peptide-methionine (R)-S-oxide reductase
LIRPDSYWRKKLTSSQYYVARRKGTEPAFSGIYWDHHDDGIYTCVGCGTPLFDSEAKFDSGTGWPSYWQVVNKNLIKLHPDTAGGVIRTEVNCRICDAHMGHVFDDGPRPTGLRFCINSAPILACLHSKKRRRSPMPLRQIPPSIKTAKMRKPSQVIDMARFAGSRQL